LRPLTLDSSVSVAVVYLAFAGWARLAMKIIRWTLMATLIMAVAGVAEAQARRGSLVVMIVSKRADYVVIGAESRTLDVSKHSFEDRSCKIISLGGDTLFYETGNAAIGVKGGTSWSSEGAARGVYAASQKRDAGDLERAWATRALRWFGAQPRRYVESAAVPPHGSLVVGGFINFDEKRALSIHAGEISFDSVKRTLVDQRSSVAPGDIGVTGIAQDLVKEFFLGKSERAVRAFGAAGAMRLVAVDAEKDVVLVRKAIQFAMDNADGEDRRALGGDIDIAIIRSDRTIRWGSRKPWCSQQDGKGTAPVFGSEPARSHK